MPSKKPPSESLESSIQTVEIAKIRMDGGTQPRAKLFEEVVDDYAEDMKQGATFPPVTIYFDGEEYWLADGFHRVRAKEAVGATEVTADVRFGTQRDAVLYAVGANAVHGLRRTNADKRRAVIRLLRDYEWRKWSDREIARRCGVGNSFVGNVRKDLTVISGQLPTTEEESELNAIRLAKKGDTTYIIDTTNIGKTTDDTKKAKKRQRAQRQSNVVTTEVIQAQQFLQGEVWKLGNFHYLFCGDPESNKFKKLLPSDIALLLLFPREEKPWLPDEPANAQNTLLFHTSYGEDIDLRNLRLIVENCISTTTEAEDSIVVFNLPDPSLFILMESLFCSCYCAEPDPRRCTDALTAWSITNQPVKKL
ncbi:streptomycin biosynthesis regulator [Acaryochloris marina NIES-2412]|uniref:streptomycin biosynthesis regulator n=1 Tax=Acaryochloris marina TaxID=155978 RepID=UPI00405A3A02